MKKVLILASICLLTGSVNAQTAAEACLGLFDDAKLDLAAASGSQLPDLCTKTSKHGFISQVEYFCQGNSGASQNVRVELVGSRFKNCQVTEGKSSNNPPGCADLNHVAGVVHIPGRSYSVSYKEISSTCGVALQ